MEPSLTSPPEALRAQTTARRTRRRTWLVTDEADNALREQSAVVRATLDDVLGLRCDIRTERAYDRYRVVLHDSTAR
jgi:hypothetical protein